MTVKALASVKQAFYFSSLSNFGKISTCFFDLYAFLSFSYVGDFSFCIHSSFNSRFVVYFTKPVFGKPLASLLKSHLLISFFIPRAMEIFARGPIRNARHVSVCFTCINKSIYEIIPDKIICKHDQKLASCFMFGPGLRKKKDRNIIF